MPRTEKDNILEGNLATFFALLEIFGRMKNVLLGKGTDEIVTMIVSLSSALS